MKNNINVGYFYIFVCCFFSAISFVFIANLIHHHNEIFSLFVTFSYATLLFSLLNFKNLLSMLRVISKNIRPFLFLNIATLFSWMGTFIALKYIDPATKISLGFGLIAVTNFFIVTPLARIKENKHLVLCVFFIITNMALIINQYAHTTYYATLTGLTLGIGWSVVGGIIGGFIGINSERLGKAGLTATQILASRFYLLIIVTAIILFFNNTSSFSTEISDWSYYFLATLIIVLLPLLMYHFAIKFLGAMMVSFIEPFTPVITYFLQITFLNYRFDLITFVLLLLLSVGIILLIKVEHDLAKCRCVAVQNSAGRAEI